MRTTDVLAAAGIGAALAFLLDPASGRRRRALVRDKMTRLARKSREGLRGSARDLSNRAQGLAAETRGLWREESADDRRVLDRVRAELGRVCTHPRAIDVDVSAGEVTLKGPVLEAEVNSLVTAISGVRGVRSVINRLEAHASAEGIQSLQGQGRLPGARILGVPRPRFSPRNTIVGVAGLAAAGAYVARRAARSH